MDAMTRAEQPLPRAEEGRVVFRVAEAARQVGVATSTLRAWDRRYGLGPSLRSPGAHRRYSLADVQRLQDLRRLINEGMPTAEAANLVTPDRQVDRPSFVAHLRQQYPALAPWQLTKRSLTTVTRAIEDAWGTRGAGGVLVGGFQRERFYRESQPRWTELCRGAHLGLVVADFAERSDPPHTPTELPLGAATPLLREWFLIGVAPAFHAHLAAWERPASMAVADGERIFETLWTVQPSVVGAALEITAQLASDDAPDLARALRSGSAASDADPERVLALATELTNRMVAYLAQ